MPRHDGAARERARRYRARGLQVDRVDFLDLLPDRLGSALCGAYRRQLTVAPRSWDWALAIRRCTGCPSTPAPT